VIAKNKKKIEMKNPNVAVEIKQANLNKKQINKGDDIEKMLADL
jgi:hypothetical protein